MVESPRRYYFDDECETFYVSGGNIGWGRLMPDDSIVDRARTPGRPPLEVSFAEVEFLRKAPRDHGLEMLNSRRRSCPPELPPRETEDGSSLWTPEVQASVDRMVAALEQLKKTKPNDAERRAIYAKIRAELGIPAPSKPPTVH